MLGLASRLSLVFILVFQILAADPAADEKFIGARRNWWAFKKPVRPAVPDVNTPWARTPIDRFIVAALQAKGLAPNPELDRHSLVRRVYLDVTGLPPTPEQTKTFLNDRSPQAYENLVDQLLASPHYGERWALRWLDVVRYADTNGFELDAERPQAWRYRDYVIRAFNENKPFDRFVQEQIAGDELWPGDKNALVATGFHRAGPVHLVGGNQDEEMNRQEVLTEMTATVSGALLGMTVGCARCHNHKFDPILQADYYRLQALMAATDGKDVDIATTDEKAAYEVANKAYKARLEPLEKQIAEIEKPTREKLRDAKKAMLEPKLREALDTPEDKRTEEQKKLAKDAKDQIGVVWDEVLEALPADQRTARAEIRRQIHVIELTEPEPPAAAYAVANMDKAPQSHILKVGDHKRKLDAVGPGFPTVLASYGVAIPETPQGRRSALARWFTSKEHPLTARVMVNRIWQLRMGTGLVPTANDFGVLGARPANPALFDWLAVEFMDRDWSVKAMDRLILTSSVYRQSAAGDAAKAKVDPDNQLWWRHPHQRLEAENLRDNIVATSGLLNAKMGGPPVRVPIEKEIYDLIFSEQEPDNLWPLTPDPTEHNRRSIYLLNKRTVRLPMLTNFDQPDTMSSCPTRAVSTHALQSLTLFNSDFMQTQSAAFAKRLETSCGSKTTCRVDSAYEVALARPPHKLEVAQARTFFKQGGTLADFCLALLNRTEFVYVP
ncbi:MAG: DUF1549 and DUF1553 domain-containing protein [Bryobacteraceae bacterium]